MMKIKTIISAVATLLVASVIGARTGANYSNKGNVSNDTLDVTPGYLPGEIRDTAEFNAMMAAKQKDYRSKISVLARCYGDSIVLRWAAEDYVSWQYLNYVGVDVMRMYSDNDGYHIDTLAHALKPATLEQLRAIYPESDSVAAMAEGVLYGNGKMRQDQSEYPIGSLGALMDVHGDQQMTFGYAVLISEWRPDIANHLAMRLVDHNVKKGQKYEYNIFPSVPDTTGHISFKSGYLSDVVNERYKEEPFETEIGDSVVGVNTIRLWWSNNKYSSYEIERREVGTQQWTRVNDKPYMVFMDRDDNADCFISDEVPHPGNWEYRVFAHDPFGDLTQPSITHTAHIRDMQLPVAPEITLINILRRNEQDPTKDIFAEIHFHKDSLEKDLVGYVPVYYHEKVNNGQWLALTKEMIAPTDTTVTVEVTGLPTGQLSIAAYDTAHNVSYSMPRLIRISDMRPPKAPLNLKAEPKIEGADTDNPLGLIKLTWETAEEDDDIDYYEIVYANDTTHQFMTSKHGIVREQEFVDTVALDVNQKYIYYKVRAVDYSTNNGDFTQTLQVIRPSLIPPTVAHIDTIHVSPREVFIRWIAGADAQMAYHNVYRKLVKTDKKWTLLSHCDADSVKACNNRIQLHDVPPVNSREDYAYAVESFNFSGISSGLSLMSIVSFTGEKVFSAPITLEGMYKEDGHETRLAWDVAKVPEGNNWYFCIWRKGPSDARFQFLMSAKCEDRFFNDYLLRPGQTAQYYVQIQMEDGRESKPSNVVTITAPAKKD